MNRRHAKTTLAGFLIVTASWSAAAAEPPREPMLDSAMELDPSLVLLGPKLVFTEGLKTLWSKALEGPEADLQREVARMITRAHRMGVPEMKQTVGLLIKVLSTEKQRPAVRLAIARTLVALDARVAASPFFELLDEEGLSFAQVVEPALATWDYKPIRKQWLARLDDARTRHGLLQLAIRGLGQVRETKAADPLTKLAQNRAARVSSRVDAAVAVGRIRDSGLVDQARTLAADKTSGGIANRLIAGKLLSRHSDESSRRLLLELAVDREPTVAAVALSRLLEIDSMLVVPLAENLLKNPDANVRMLAAKALAGDPVSSSVEQLRPVLNDRHPDVRLFACRTLFSFGLQATLKSVVRETGTQILSQEEWRGQEQAALLLGALDHKPSAPRLITLLDAPRQEARTAAAWALRKLAIESTLPAMLAHATKIADKRKQDYEGTHDEQLVQLMQYFGQQKSKPAIEVMWRLISKTSPFSMRERVAAIWALGHIDVGGRRSELSTLLQGRLADFASLMPEGGPVRAMSAVSLGRMKAAEAVATLRRFYENDMLNSDVGLACRWAIHNMTGEWLPGPTPRIVEFGGWSLAPLPPPASK
jgi:HEAT repeat protein